MLPGTLRSFAVSSYIILYKPFDTGVEILGIPHVAREKEKILGRFIDSP